MGKRNLAIVGTHEDFFAEIFDEKVGIDPSFVSQCASPEDAATSYFNDIFHNTNGFIRTAAVAVWPVSGGLKNMKIFEIHAMLDPCLEYDAGPGQYDVFIDVRERV